MSTDMGDLPKPRLCHLKKWPDFEGYGFHLQAMKDAPGQFIGKVDEGSPAESARLQPGDKIIEVNGVNVEGENHAQVVQRIKAVPSETKLLVIEPTAYEVYKRRGAVVRGDADGVRCYTTADSKSDSQKNKGGLTMVADSPDVEHVAGSRLCHLRLRPDFQGYGFNLQAEKSKPGQFIGKVEAGSPAETSGLRLGDRLLEVNGVNVTGETHGQVVQRIKAISGETKLLVVDPDSFVEHIQKMEETNASPQHHAAAAPLTNGSHHHQEEEVEEDAEERVHHEPVAAASAAQYHADYDADRRSDSDVERQNSYDRNNSKLDDEERAALAEVDRATDHADHSNNYENSRDSRTYDSVDNENSRDSHEYNDWKLDTTTTSSYQQAPPKKEEPPAYAYSSIGETNKPTTTTTPVTSSYSSSVQSHKTEEKSYHNQTSSASATSSTPVSPGPVTIDGIYFPASAREMREKMGGKKKVKDPRLSANLSMAEKHKLFERL